MGHCKCHEHKHSHDDEERRQGHNDCHCGGDDCHCGHSHESEQEEGLRGQIIRICAAAILLIIAVIVEHTVALPLWALLLVYLAPYLTAGIGVLHEAAEGICEGDIFNENLLMSIATIGALAIGFLPGGEPEFAEAVFVMLFFLIGEAFETYAEGRSRDSIGHLMDLKPDEAHVMREGKEQTVNPEELTVGDTIIVKPGEKVPVDGTITSGASSMDTVALTGESAPRDVNVGDQILSGFVNRQGAVTMRVDKAYNDSTAAKVLKLVEESGEKKSKSETFISRFAKVYTPIVVIAALAVAIIPPFFTDGGYAANFTTWLGRALTFLVVSCPCALVISVPLTFFGGIGGASKRGILIKGSTYIDSLAKIGTVVFDKTGTLTEGRFRVTSVCPNEISESDLLHLAAHVESLSTHPIALSLVEAYAHMNPAGCNECNVANVTEVAGKGLTASINGRHVAVGNDKLMEAEGAEIKEHEHIGTVIHVAIDGQYAGHIVVSDVVKEDAGRAIKALHKVDGVRTVMLTGDRAQVASSVAKELGVDECHAELLPADKVNHVERLLAEKAADRTLAFVGDGINDAPVLARADVGIAMGALGSDAAIEAADVVLMDDKPSRVAEAISIAQKVLSIARQNVIFAIGIKVAVLILAALGFANMWMAVFADVGVTVIAVLNAMRALRQ